MDIRWISDSLYSPDLAFILVVGILHKSYSFCVNASLGLEDKLAMAASNLDGVVAQIDDLPFLIGLTMVLVKDDLLVDLNGLVDEVDDLVGLGNRSDLTLCRIDFLDKELLLLHSFVVFE